MTKRRRRRKEAGGRMWEVGPVTPPESIDEAGIADLIFISENTSGTIIAQDIVPRPALPEEVRELVEEAFRNTILIKRPRRIAVVGEDYFNEVKASPVLEGATVVHERNPLALPLLREEMERSAPMISEGTLIGAREHKKEIAGQAARLNRIAPWEFLYDSERLKLDGEGITHPIVSVLGAMGEVFGVTFFRSEEETTEFEEFGREIEFGAISPESLAALDVMTLWLETEEDFGDLGAEAARRQGLAVDDERYPRAFWLRPGAEQPDLRTAEESRRFLRHLEALAAALEAIAESDDSGWPPLEKWTAEVALSDGTKVSIAPAPAILERITPRKILRMRISLDDIEPEIWRLVDVPDNFTLAQLHDVIQGVMDWDDDHLWEFSRGKTRYSPMDDFWSPQNVGDPFITTLYEVLGDRSKKLNYVYDFGDNWRITIMVERRLDPEEGVEYPRLVESQGEAPSEDSGGPWQYQDFQEEETAYSLVEVALDLENLAMDIIFNSKTRWTDFVDPDTAEDEAITLGLQFVGEYGDDPNVILLLLLLRAIWQWGHPFKILEHLIEGPTLPREPTLARVLKRLPVVYLDEAAEFWGVDLDELTRRGQREAALQEILGDARALAAGLVGALDRDSYDLLTELASRQEPLAIEEFLQQIDCEDVYDEFEYIAIGPLGELRRLGLVFMGTSKEGGSPAQWVTVPLELRESLREILRSGPSARQ